MAVNLQGRSFLKLLDFKPREVRYLLDLARNAIVICTCGGGTPTVCGENREPRGTEAVIDKDLAGELLARELEAALYLMATDVDAVYADWGAPEARAIKRASPEALRQVEPAPLRNVTDASGPRAFDHRSEGETPGS